MKLSRAATCLVGASLVAGTANAYILAVPAINNNVNSMTTSVSRPAFGSSVSRSRSFQGVAPATPTTGLCMVAATTTVPLSQVKETDSVMDAPLLRDIELLSEMLADVVLKEDPTVHDLYTKFRTHGQNRATANGNADSQQTHLDHMIQCAKDISPEHALGVMRTFGLALNLINAAEVHHRVRTLRRSELEAASAAAANGVTDMVGPLPMVEDGVRGTFDKLLKNLKDGSESMSDDDAKQAIFNALLEQKVEIILTAHPTEVNRRTVLRKYRSITDTLRRLDRPDLHPYERKECLTQLRRVIAGLWGTNEIRLTKPTPQQEAAGGIAIIESVLWDAVPAYLRKLDAQCRASLGAQLPIDGAAGPPITFGSWIGGDRDGNPNVTPAVTEEVVMHQRLRAAKLLLADLTALYNDLAISSRFSSEMQTLADSIPHSSDKFELYRRVIGHLRQRLVCTIKECETAFATYSTIDANEPTTTPGSSNPNPSTAVDEGSAAAVVTPIYKAAELLEPLTIMYHSLQETGLDLVADGLLVDTIRRLQVFGMTLVPLDVREESTLHTNALDAITQWIGVEEGSSYREWDEPKRLAWLTKELSGNRPLFRTRDIDTIPAFDASVKKTLKTFLTLSGQEPEALGAYVISQAQTASDVLAVKLLQQQFGMTAAKGNSMRVSPLFETLDDLVNAPEVLDTLMSIPVYTNMIHSKQEIMVGYSDSAKDAGRLAANWALYESQEKMIQVAMAHGVELTFFHGKGGTVGRGGNPALYRAILSHPPNTINGRFRVTEQGEMITQNFGSPNIAERTLDIYTAAVLNEKFTQHVLPTDEWRTEMERMSAVSCEDYRFLVREEPRFVPYFRQATPELELGSLNIGSRPAKRNPKGGIESLRAIPWTFAWTQTRLHLSSWLGVGKGLSPDECSEESATRMKNMYKQWPWFAENVDLITMILSKTDYSISQNYDEQLVDRTPELIGLGDDVRRKLEQTRMAVLAVQESDDYQGEHVTITRASNKIRNPYVDPLNIVQAELLKRLRAMEKEEGAGADAPASLEKKHLQNALIVSINGISQGMRNSG